MQSKAQDDEQVMNLVELALARPPEDREHYLHSACADNSELFDEAWRLVNWEQQMNGFLLDPLYPPLATDRAFAPGELLDGRFRIVRALAEGGMGVVYEAWDEKLERRIAVKAAKAGYRRRLPPEVRHASEISHPNICKTFEIHTASTDYGEVDFLTMEYIEGETLFSWLRRGRMPDDQVLAVGLQLCAGLGEAHKHNVIHGDLKPGNVLLTSDPNRAIRAVITDFGLAHRPDTTVQTIQSGAQGGTPAYMAPELWKGSRPSVASDIYALGIILYEMASGHVPLGPEATWEQRLTWRPQPVNKKWDRVLSRCLDPDPAKRFQSAEEVAQALKPVSRRWVVGAAAAVVLAAVSGGVTYYRATLPETTVRLAVLPFETESLDRALGENLARETAAQVGKVKGDKHTGFILESDATKASHVLSTTLHRDGGKLKLHAVVTNAAAREELKQWDAEYEPGQTRYIPVALRGVVTETLHLKPAVAATVNALAKADYDKGVARMRYDSGVDEALTLLERAVAEDPDSALTHAALAMGQATKYTASNDSAWWKRSKAEMREAELRNPDAPPVHLIEGVAAYQSGSWEDAANEFQRAIDLEPTSDAYRFLGKAYEAGGRLPEALAAYQSAARIEPKYYRVHISLGNYYSAALAKFEEAVGYYQKAVDLAPQEPDAHFRLGRVYRMLGRDSDAEKELRLAIQLNPARPDPYHTLGLLLMHQRREKEAIPEFERAVALVPEAYFSWMDLGICYRLTGDARRAENAFRRSLVIADGVIQKNARESYARSVVAYLSACLGDSSRARSEIAQALQLSPKDPDVLFQGAKTYEELHEREKTLALLAGSPPGVLGDLARQPQLESLRADARFQALLNRKNEEQPR